MLGYLLFQPGLVFRLLVGLPLLAHLGYTGMIPLPMGLIPRHPDGSKQARRNQDLRSWVVRFLNEVREFEDYLWRARSADSSSAEVSEKLRLGRQRVMAVASQVARAGGSAPLEAEEITARGAVAGMTRDAPAYRGVSPSRRTGHRPSPRSFRRTRSAATRTRHRNPQKKLRN